MSLYYFSTACCDTCATVTPCICTWYQVYCDLSQPWARQPGLRGQARTPRPVQREAVVGVDALNYGMSGCSTARDVGTTATTVGIHPQQSVYAHHSVRANSQRLTTGTSQSFSFDGGAKTGPGLHALRHSRRCRFVQVRSWHLPKPPRKGPDRHRQRNLGDARRQTSVRRHRMPSHLGSVYPDKGGRAMWRNRPIQ